MFFTPWTPPMAFRSIIYLSSFQKVAILSLETPNSKVMTENVRQGFHHRQKSLIFHMGIFRTQKMHKSSYNFRQSCPNGLKFGTFTLWDSLKKMPYQIFDFLIFRDFLASESPKNAIFCQFLPIRHFSGSKKSQKIKITKIWQGIFLKLPQRLFSPNFSLFGPLWSKLFRVL